MLQLLSKRRAPVLGDQDPALVRPAQAVPVIVFGRDNLVEGVGSSISFPAVGPECCCRPDGSGACRRCRDPRRGQGRSVHLPGVALGWPLRSHRPSCSGRADPDAAPLGRRVGRRVVLDAAAASDELRAAREVDAGPRMQRTDRPCTKVACPPGARVADRASDRPSGGYSV